MPRRARDPDRLYIGIGGNALAIDAETGEPIWSTGLKSSSYVTICLMGSRVYAGAGGELFCLDARDGAILWRNKLKGYGTGLIGFAGTDIAAMQAAIAAQEAAAAAVVTS